MSRTVPPHAPPAAPPTATAFPDDGSQATTAKRDLPPLAVFDLDGTLVDTAPDLAESLNHCLSSVGLARLELEIVRPHAGHGAKAMLREAYALAGRDLTEVELDAQVERFVAYYADHIAIGSSPFPGALAALDRLEAAGWRLAVCTNKYERLAVKLLDELGLAPRFAAICGADTFARRKPDPLHLTETIARAGGAVSNAVMIGDTDTDIDTAINAGVPSILVAFGYAPEARARDGASAIIDSYDRLDPAFAAALIAGGAAPDRPRP